MTDPGQNPTLTRLAELEGRVERLEQEREMSETTETSLYERLRDAASDTWTNPVHPEWGEVSYYRVKTSSIDAIQEAIEAPLRERVAALEREGERLLDLNGKYANLAVECRHEHAALKARADAMRVAAADAYAALPLDDPTREPLGDAIHTYLRGAADRAGETQDETTEGLGHGEPVGVPVRDYAGSDGGRSHSGDPIPVVAVPSPTDAAAEGDTSSIESRLAAVEHVVGLAKEQAPYGLLGPNINPLHLANRVEDLERDVKSILAQLKAMGMVQEDDSKAIADLERWREGVDQKLADLDKIEYDWTSLRDAYDNRVKDYVDIKDQHDRMAWKVIRIEQRLDALRGTDSKSPNPESTAWKDGWHAGHEAGYRSGQESVPLRGPEVTVTDEMVQAYWLTAHTESLNTNSSMAMLIRAGLEAVFALRAGGAGQ